MRTGPRPRLKARRNRNKSKALDSTSPSLQGLQTAVDDPDSPPQGLQPAIDSHDTPSTELQQSNTDDKSDAPSHGSQSLVEGTLAASLLITECCCHIGHPKVMKRFKSFLDMAHRPQVT